MSTHSTDHKLSIAFDNAGQQKAAARLGMWIFLATELLFFGGLFVAYIVYRYQYGEGFAIASRELSVPSGGIMTALLLTGSLLVAVCDWNIEDSESTAQRLTRFLVPRLVITACLGAGFLALEFYEYSKLLEDHRFPGPNFVLADFPDAALHGRSVEMFFVLFFCMTGLHALHMIIGVLLVSATATATYYSKHPSGLANWLASIGLYWHFVDIIWIFLFPLFYLIR